MQCAAQDLPTTCTRRGLASSSVQDGSAKRVWDASLNQPAGNWTTSIARDTTHSSKNVLHTGATCCPGPSVHMHSEPNGQHLRARRFCQGSGMPCSTRSLSRTCVAFNHPIGSRASPHMILHDSLSCSALANRFDSACFKLLQSSFDAGPQKQRRALNVQDVSSSARAHS